MLKRILSTAFAAVFLVICAQAQNPVQWKLEQKSGEASVAAGSSVEVKLLAEIESGWHLYAIDQPDGGPIKTTIKLAPDSDFELAGDISATEPVSQPDPNFVVDDKPLVTKFYKDAASFDLTAKAAKDTT